MKFTVHVLLSAAMLCTSTLFGKTDPIKKNEVDALNKSGYAFTVNVSQINSRYSEIPSAMFRDRLVIVSSKKIGAFSSKNPVTNEPFTDLFYLDISENGSFSQPLLFSSILNTKASEGQASFSPDERTVYYTRSSRKYPRIYKLYMAKLHEEIDGYWMDETELTISSHFYSVENPHVSADGKYLYFSSNKHGGFGGFDIYRAKINPDGSIADAENLGSTINTEKDEKYPFTTSDNSELYFSSKGHNSIGGYDIFISSIYSKAYSSPRNLGQAINSNKDDVGFMIINGNRGVFSSNKDKESGFNIYHFEAEAIYQELNGIVMTSNEEVLPNSTVILLNSTDQEIDRLTTDETATYNFRIMPFEDYKIVVKKEGYEEYVINLNSKDRLKTILKLSSKLTKL
ncbi:hypothetical protein [Winogradskyella sp. SYSU M77433]|uniref:carboxypeptidase regulatory-like domain-containing protein n=1 Tax=Winogradskyella sp. SYSU M77433 TaxID=3042722 RepID=UPI00248000F4|nr:hypothetical protein [Winogradskyella sp. SYSU M77433]MDH7911736.1 hypothetical protein [Winogradskyella sp. SYSU M77433]